MIELDILIHMVIAGYLMDKYGRKSTAIPSLVLFIISLFLVSFANNYYLLIFVSILFGFSDGISTGLLMTIGADIAPFNCRSQFLGFYRMASTSADVIAPIIIGYLSSNVNIFTACLSAIIVSTFSLIWIIFFVKEPSKYRRLDNIDNINDQNTKNTPSNGSQQMEMKTLNNEIDKDVNLNKQDVSMRSDSLLNEEKQIQSET